MKYPFPDAHESLYKHQISPRLCTLAVDSARPSTNGHYPTKSLLISNPEQSSFRIAPLPPFPISSSKIFISTVPMTPACLRPSPLHLILPSCRVTFHIRINNCKPHPIWPQSISSRNTASTVPPAAYQHTESPMREAALKKSLEGVHQ